ncbi:hypothetical protein [Streptomyces sp. NPDC057238]|uniref:hypothetical protein n=1 Tax=Streptomyces sp. NPDC057238 TaxID=3346060 RepID=UPI0036327302
MTDASNPQPPARADVDGRERARLLRFRRTAHRAGVLVRLDRTLPEHCPARITRYGKRSMLRIAPGLTQAERLGFLRAATETTP